MHLSLPIGSTSKIIQIPIFDSSSTIGALLAGLVYNTASLTAYYNREGAAGAATAITLATATKGTWATGGFIAVDGTNTPGWYELHIPDAALASGAKSVVIHLKGAANMVPVPILIELTAVNNQDAVRGGMTSLPATGTLAVNPTLAAVTHTGAVIPTVTDVTNLHASAATAAALATAIGYIDTEIQAILDIVAHATYGNVALNTDIDALLARLTATRAGYLDKLNITGNVAASGEVTAIQNNTRVRVIVPALMERPDAGSTAYKLHLYIYDTNGNMEAPDSAPTITAVNEAGTSRSANLGVVTLEGTGHYSATYTLSSGDAIEQLIFEWTIIEGGLTRLHGAPAQVVDTTAVDFTAADRTKLDTLHDTRLSAARAGYLDNLSAGAVALEATLTAMKGAGWTTETLKGIRDALLTAAQVKAQVDASLDTAIPATPTAGSVNDKIKSNLNATVSSRSSFDPATQTVDMGKINGSAPASAQLALSAATMFNGTAIAGTTDLAVTVLDQLNGRRIIFAKDTTTVALRGQATNITGTTAAGKLTFTALTTAPAVGDTFSVV